MKYVLITPAHNEEKNIEKTISSVIRQALKPGKWVIVSDGSTDRTDEIINQYINRHRWIELVRMPEHRGRHFAAKVNAFNAGYEKVKNFCYEVIGNLDADISFESDYFQYLISKFHEDPRLGVAGTPFVEDGRHYDYRFTNIEHVSGACQLFRRECFEEIGGYVPMKKGGVDWVAVTTARMQGWKTRTFSEKICYHHRKIGTSSASALMTWFRQGQKDYCLGNHPLWEFFRVFYQMTKRPFVIGGTLIFLGFSLEGLRGIERPISEELKGFIRGEQMRRLKNAFRFGA
jgi:glycosyltransferase involved in cell wall biosynthesis